MLKTEHLSVLFSLQSLSNNRNYINSQIKYNNKSKAKRNSNSNNNEMETPDTKITLSAVSATTIRNMECAFSVHSCFFYLFILIFCVFTSDISCACH